MMILSPNVGPVTKYPINVGIGPVIRSVLADYTPNLIKFPFIEDFGYVESPWRQITGIDTSIVLRIDSGANGDNTSAGMFIGQIPADPQAQVIYLSSGSFRPVYDLVTVKPNQWIALYFTESEGVGDSGTCVITNGTTDGTAIDSFNWSVLGGG